MAMEVDMNANTIKTVGIVGAGTMGNQIGLCCALNGYDVIIYDASEVALSAAPGRITKLANMGMGYNLISAKDFEHAMTHITYTGTLDPLSSADLINESIPEDPELKGRLFSQLNELCPPHTIFTTNTSTLIPSEFAEATGRPARFAALHFHNVFTARLVDIMPHSGTAPEVLPVLRDFVERLGQVPLLLKKETPGYIYNALFGVLNGKAIDLWLNDVASVEDIDRAWMTVTGMPIGPFGLMDQVGLDTVWHIAKARAKKTGDPAEMNFVELWKKKFLDEGLLGEKSGKGFYTYPHPSYSRPDFIKGGRPT
jgi:3-hydroxybutyryl-CoA dehydrogenase